MTASDFTDDENWHGGFYELALELGERSDARLQTALDVMWSDRRLNGCFSDRSRQPDEQERMQPTVAAQAEAGHLRGLATLPSGFRTVCGSVAIRSEDDEQDWLDLYIPMGSLARADERVGAYPFGSMMTVGHDAPSRDSLEWRRPIDDWLTEIASSVFEAVPFRLGLIGFETSGSTTADELTQVPDERYVAYLVPAGRDLVVHPATI